MVPVFSTILDLTHHHATLPGCVGSAGGASVAGLGGNVGVLGTGSNSSTVLGELGVQDLLLERAQSPVSARMAYTSEKHPRSTFNELNLVRKRQELCDVVLHVGSRKIFAHKVILAACSNYFRAMFTGELAESRQTEITIREVDESAMEILIDFCYTSHIVVEESNVQTLLPAACLLQLAEIQEVCCEFLKRQLDPSNCLGIRAFADTHSCRDLLRIADKVGAITILHCGRGVVHKRRCFNGTLQIYSYKKWSYKNHNNHS